MLPDSLLDLPKRPPAVADWEDLLYRMELMTRALKVTLEDETGRDAAVGATLRDALDVEARVGRWLAAHAQGSAAEKASTLWPAESDAAGDHVPTLLDRLIALRKRNFAMVQRRGVDVWDWHGEVEGVPGTVTVYQLFAGLVRHDGALLAGLRAQLRSGAAEPC